MDKSLTHSVKEDTSSAMFPKGKSIFTALACAFSIQNADAKPIDLIFVNDLHSYMEPHYDGETGTFRGGYAKVKTIVDQYRADSKAKGHEVMALNAGDFLEGHPFYFVDSGQRSLEAIHQFEFDGSVLGNHDWLMNATGLDDLAQRFMAAWKTPFEFLGANFIINPETYTHIGQSLKPYKTVVKDGIRFAVLGLTTPSLFYKWAAHDGKEGADISNPYKKAREWIPELRKNHDFVIALTHLGEDIDKKLIEKTDGIDLVVGGHSHSYFPEPKFAEDKRGLNIPYVQAESFGHYVGRMTLDVEAGKPLTIVPGTFEQREIDANVQDEPGMAKFVADTRTRMENQFGAGWLNEVIAVAKTPLITGEKGNPTNMSQLFINSIKNATQVDFAFDLSVFHGISVPAGPLTRESILQLHPRLFEFEKNTGWTIYTARLKGAYIKAMIQAAARFNYFFTSQGLDYDLEPLKKDPNRFKAKNLRVGGKKVRSFKNYTVATSEGMIRGAIAALPIMKIIIRKSHDTGITMWDAIEKELRRLSVVDAKTLPWPKQAFPGGKAMPPIVPGLPEIAITNDGDEDFESTFQNALVEELNDVEAEDEETN